MLRRAVAALVLALALLPSGAGVASAHGGGLEPGPSVPRVLAVDPPVPGLTVTVIEAGARLRIDNGTGRTVEVLAEPRGDPGPTVPAGATARWADPRIVAAVHAGPVDGARPWFLPLSVGGEPVTVHGEQAWPPPPASGLWWLATGAVAVATVMLGRRAVRGGRAAPALAGVTVLAVAAHVVHVLGAALIPEEQSYLAVALGAAGIGTVAWLAGLVGAGLALAGRRFGLLLCALAGALLALVTSVDVSSFWSAVLPFGWSPTLDRLATVVTVGAGAGLFLTGFAVLRALEHPEDTALTPPSPR